MQTQIDKFIEHIKKTDLSFGVLLESAYNAESYAPLTEEEFDEKVFAIYGSIAADTSIGVFERVRMIFALDDIKINHDLHVNMKTTHNIDHGGEA